MAEWLIEMEAVTLRLGRHTLIGGITLSLAAGEMIGLVGANGGGKTSTLRMLAGLAQSDGGTGKVLGADVRAPRRLMREIGFMPQRCSLYPELTLRENLRFRCDAFDIPDYREVVAMLAETYGLESVLDQRVAHLSGGWSRRAQFAATILHKPRLLLLDEPTAGLDARTRRDLWSWIKALAAAGCGVIVSTHDLAEAEALPRIVYYQNGHAHPMCSPGELMATTCAATLEEAVIALAGTP